MAVGGARHLEGLVLVASYLKTAALKSIIGTRNGAFGEGSSRAAAPEQYRFWGNMARYKSGPPKATAPQEPGSDYEIARYSSRPSQTAAPEQAGFPHQIA